MRPSEMTKPPVHDTDGFYSSQTNHQDQPAGMEAHRHAGKYTQTADHSI